MITETEPKSATTVRLLNERIVQCNRGVRLVDLAKDPEITLSYSGAAYSEVSTHTTNMAMDAINAVMERRIGSSSGMWAS